MSSVYCEKAIADALEYGRALLKFISPNDAGATRSHQSGFYLPVHAWQMFTPHPPVRGDENPKHEIHITWQDDRTTESVITWYGRRKSEYRLTRFGRGFPFLNDDAVGNLLVLIPVAIDRFHAYVLDLEDDIEEVQAALGVQILDRWGVYDRDREDVETENECIDRHFAKFVAALTEFPPGSQLSEATRVAMIDCINDFLQSPSDERLLGSIDAEYKLFRLLERRISGPQMCRLFTTVDDFLSTATSIMNRRKSRAGRAFENHFQYVLKDAGIPFDSGATVDGRPDLVIPSVAAYHDASYPIERLFVVGLKTTCKDRWRQVLNEGKRVPRKHLVTLQEGISKKQLAAMVAADVSLIVPKSLHRQYPPDSPMPISSIEEFARNVKQTLAG